MCLFSTSATQPPVNLSSSFIMQQLNHFFVIITIFQQYFNHIVPFFIIVILSFQYFIVQFNLVYVPPPLVTAACLQLLNPHPLPPYTKLSQHASSTSPPTLYPPPPIPNCYNTLTLHIPTPPPPSLLPPAQVPLIRITHNTDTQPFHKLTFYAE